MDSLTVGCPKEIKLQENRIGVTPAGVSQERRCGLGVIAEAHASDGAGYTDEELVDAGAGVVGAPEAISDPAQLLVEVKEPLSGEMSLLPKCHVSFSYLYLATDKALTDQLVETGATAIGDETAQIGVEGDLIQYCVANMPGGLCADVLASAYEHHASQCPGVGIGWGRGSDRGTPRARAGNRLSRRAADSIGCGGSE